MTDALWESSDDFTTEDLAESLETKFLSGKSLGNRRLRLTNAGVKNMPLRDPKTGQTEKKPVLAFTNGKLLTLNKVNRQALKDALGDDPSKWLGAVVEVRTESTSMGPGIRLSVISKSKKPGPASTDPEMDDDIPF
jgi:hypothetical protein